MELKKKYIHMSHEKGRAMSQVTLDDDYNVPESKPDIVRIITTKGAIRLEEAKAETGHVLLKGNLGFQDCLLRGRNSIFRDGKFRRCGGI